MSEGRFRIAVLGCKGLPFPGGIETIMMEIGRRFVRCGYGFDVFVRRHYMRKHGKIKHYDGIELHYSIGLHTKHMDAISHSFSAMFKVLLGRYDIVYFNAIGITLLAGIPKLFGRKVIVQVHGLDFRRAKWGLIARLWLRLSCYTTVWFADRILCVSRVDKRYFDQRFGVDCVYIPNGMRPVEPSAANRIYQRWGLERGKFVLFMARLVPEKGCHLILEAFKGLNTDKRLVVAGSDFHGSGYAARLKRSAGDDVLFAGFVEGELKRELLSNAFCFVLPSLLEAMPLSLLEAMGYGRCIIASDLEEIRDILQSDGIYFRTGSVADLRRRLSEVLSDPESAISRGRSLQRRVRAFHDWDRLFDAYLQVVENIASSFR